MNWSLFRSPHLFLATAFVVLPVSVMLVNGVAPGRDSARSYLLLTGWIALLLFLLVMAYVLRKYMHKLGYSPEFRMRVAIDRLERVERRTNELRVRITRGSLIEGADILERARRILKEEGVSRVIRAEVVAGPPPGPPFRIRVLPTEPLGRVAKWLHAHLYYGTAAAFLVVLHGGGDLSTPMGILLNLGSALVIVTGLVGIFLWARGPRWMTEREQRLGITIEMAYALNHSLERKVKAVLQEVDEGTRVVLEDIRAADDSPQRARRAMESFAAARDTESVDAMRDALALIGQSRRVQARLHELRRVRNGFMAWRWIHVPAAVLLLGVLTVHVLSIWVY